MTSGSWPSSPGGPGWYPDTRGTFESRYWDGTEWTSAVMSNGQTQVDLHFEPAGSRTPAADVCAPTQQGGRPGPPDATLFPYVDLGPAALVRHTSLDPATAELTMANLLAGQGAVVNVPQHGRIDGSLVVKEEINVALCIVLFLLCIIGGVIYLIMKQNKTKTLQVTVTMSAQGLGTLVQGYCPPEAFGLLNAAFQLMPA